MKVKIKYKEPKIILKPKYNEVWLLKEALNFLQAEVNYDFVERYNQNVFDNQEIEDSTGLNNKVIANMRDELIRILDNIDPY